MERLKDWLNEQNIDFVRWRFLAGGISGAMVIASWLLFFFGSPFTGDRPSPNWGIDFTGGTELQLRFSEPVEIGEVRQAVSTLDVGADSVQQVGAPEEHEFKIRIQDPNFGAAQAEADLRAALEQSFGADWVVSSRFDAEVGARMVVTYKGDVVAPKEVEAKLSNMAGVTAVPGRDDHEVVIQLPGLELQIERELHKALGDRKFEVRSVDAVGPKVGADLRQQAFVAMFATLFLVLVYVAFRFELSFAPGAILAVFHDASVTIGIFVLMERELTLSLVGALLTIIGYSLNDTIVIYDRLRENREKYRRKGTAELVNLTLNETLLRTISTSFNTLLAILPFLVLGGAVVEDFAFAMLLGIIFGSYSTIYVASPMILFMEELQPYIGRFINTKRMAAPEEVLEGGPQGPMTESEKRRRERSDREKAEQKKHR